jgi:hypothetical protein
VISSSAAQPSSKKKAMPEFNSNGNLGYSNLPVWSMSIIHSSATNAGSEQAPAVWSLAIPVTVLS